MTFGSARRRRTGLAWASLLLAAFLPISLGAAFPSPRGFVNDFAAVLDASTITRLEALLKDVERDTSAELALVTVPSLDGMTVEKYANGLFHEWGIGKKADNNGVLVLVAPNERKVRIEVGYGLEGILPDALAGEIIRIEIIPEFKNGNYASGAQRGIERVARVLRREPGANNITAAASHEPSSGRPPALIMIPFLGAFVVFGAFFAGLGARTRTAGPLLFAGLFGGVPFIVSLIFSAVATTAILGPLGVAMFVLGFRKGQTPYWMRTLRAGTVGDVSSGWVMGGTSDSGGGSSGDSGSSGGDFGGGDSGGGGASGSW